MEVIPDGIKEWAWDGEMEVQCIRTVDVARPTTVAVVVGKAKEWAEACIGGVTKAAPPYRKSVGGPTGSGIRSVTDKFLIGSQSGT